MQLLGEAADVHVDTSAHGVAENRLAVGALAVGEARTGWTIRQFVRTARRYRTIQIRAGSQILTAEAPLPPELRDALSLIL